MPRRPSLALLSPFQFWNPQAVTELTPAVPGAIELTAIAVLMALAGMQGLKMRFRVPTAGAVPTGWVKFIVPDIVPVMVALPKTAVVAFASIEKPQIYVVTPAAAGNVAVVAPVVPVADAVIIVAPIGLDWANAGDAIADRMAIITRPADLMLFMCHFPSCFMRTALMSSPKLPHSPGFASECLSSTIDGVAPKPLLFMR
jgi:hypothetical protein